MDISEKWPSSEVGHLILMDVVGKFIRTHQGGMKRLMELLDSVPADRTEEEHRQLMEADTQENEAAREAMIADYNARRASHGLPPVDRNLEVIPERKP